MQSKGSGAGLSSPSILPRYHKDVPANPYPNKCNPISLWHVTCINRRKETRKVKVSVMELWDAINPNINKIISRQHYTD
ncbi:Os09g0322600 [Oryza sativa Japonica Group]|uniref:Os09g0322600 protein n=1 Tax=Oryza sativa subsp. japonica TaxID=39947 RepID=Q0J2N2_ORYSJ|nr:Os09g0322600 [Oryza sativa Japonica Group]|eukprot:NP_001062866.1 Os09g0322600 [Oryza sativa Japonica Group]